MVTCSHFLISIHLYNSCLSQQRLDTIHIAKPVCSCDSEDENALNTHETPDMDMGS